ncbi:MAG: ImmA/IrrE family metallo-endopeptidase [Myxococcota bacterium]
MQGEDKAIAAEVARLHHLVQFSAPPLDLARIFELRPDLQVRIGDEETPLELQREGDHLVIIMPPGGDPSAERMLLAHALGHAVLHPVPVLCEGEWPEEEIPLDEPGAAADVFRESQAHSFALALLMPMEMFEEHNALRVTLFMKGEEVDAEVERLSEIFGVPAEAVRARLHRLMERNFRLQAGHPGRKP